MKSSPKHSTTIRGLLGLAMIAGMAVPHLQTHAGTVNIATGPLANSTTTSVLPNLMFVIDNSGSMDWSYLPDWVNTNLCKSGDGSYTRSCMNQPPYRSPDFNGVYYNPAITYHPPVNADGSSRPNQTTWTWVKNDAYGIQSTGSTNLVSYYSDMEWCTDAVDKNENYTYADCLRNDNYLLPGVVNGKAYRIPHSTYASGNGYAVTGTHDAPVKVAGKWGPHYYEMIAGEYCDSPRLTNCQTTKTETFKFPAKLRWCSDAAMTVCQSTRTSVYKIPRYPTKRQGAVATVTVGSGGSTSVSSIKVNGLQILSNDTKSSNSSSTVAMRIANSINQCAEELSGDCDITGYSANYSGNDVMITAPASLGPITYTPVIAKSGGKSVTATAFAGYTTVPGSFKRVDIVDSVNSYDYPPGSGSKAPSRTDCAGTTCTYAEEMTNFANWWTYYRTRMQTMKTAASRAFKAIDNRYRVGLITIANQSYDGNYLPIDRFDSGSGLQKEKWYNALFKIDPTTSTPLRSALSVVGRIYAGQKPVGTADPVQYSCQQNFTLLTTDGYWNTDTDAAVKGLDGNPVGNMDSDSASRPMYEGPTAVSNSLADVAKYYYDKDLRSPSLNNCTGSLGLDVCTDNVFIGGKDNNVKQHMTTFTLGLGIDGTLAYTSDYETAESGDFYNLKKGLGSPVANWPVPKAETETAVDDLWHAAVNGRGVYFSAKDPVQLTLGLNSALSSIGAKLGSGAAAATSTLNPVANNNFAYVASYTTVKWTGNLEARTINLDTGAVSETASWCAEDVVASSCPAPGEVVTDTSGSSSVQYCVTPDATAETCTNGVLDGGSCKVEMQKSCTGTMKSRVTATSDSRAIWMNDGSGTLVPFNYDNLNAAGKSAHFSGTGLSQWSLLDSTQKANAAGSNLVNYLRGQTGYEDRASNDAGNRLYRFRETVFGDPTESQPAFIGKSTFKYTDAGYADFVNLHKDRPKTIYIGANDGMLHAFDATTGQERWAYVPTMVIPNLWKLADKNYANMHTNYVNGSPAISDIYAEGSWKTILVAGLNGGGRGYYALDITDPLEPKLLWEIDTSIEPDLGYTYGDPVITKLKNGTWVVLFTSGYNNINPGDGKGWLYVRNAFTGAHIRRISTEAGDTTTPSGLAKIASWVDEVERNNTAGYTYGGDLHGNLWRFDINDGTKTKFAVLRDPVGVPQPITTEPELGAVFVSGKEKHVIFVGTGKYLETSDLTTTQTQTIYALKDDGASTTFDDPRSSPDMVRQTISTSGASRNGSALEVDFAKTRGGWYVDLPDTGERVNIAPKLSGQTLIVPSTVPSNTVCAPGGYGWLNYFNYKNGHPLANNIVSQKFNAPIVGVNVYHLENGKRIVSAVTSDQPTPKEPSGGAVEQDPGGGGNGGFQGTRLIWRELFPDSLNSH